MIERLLKSLFEYQEIRDGCEADSSTGPAYLRRYFLVRNDGERSGVPQVPRWNLTWHRKGNGVQVYLHHILRSDADRELHDHPWAFLSFILWRGYREETEVAFDAIGIDRRDVRWTRTRRKWPGMILFRRAEHRHRVLLDRPAWTLVVTSGKRRSWGFWRDGSFIPWRNFVARKCEERARSAPLKAFSKEN